MDLYLGGSPFFSSSKAYKHLIGHMVTPPIFSWLWKSCCQNKHKVFFWLLLKDRLSTRGLFKRRNMILPSYDCVCCLSNVEEDLAHLFITCTFAKECWASIGLMVYHYNPWTVFNSLKGQLNVTFFMETIILMSWCIWMQRNDLIFRGLHNHPSNCKLHFKRAFALVVHRAKAHHKEAMSSWLEALL